MMNCQELNKNYFLLLSFVRNEWLLDDRLLESGVVPVIELLFKFLFILEFEISPIFLSISFL
jgi:hypothetical protein